MLSWFHRHTDWPMASTDSKLQQHLFIILCCPANRQKKGKMVALPNPGNPKVPTHFLHWPKILLRTSGKSCRHKGNFMENGIVVMLKGLDIYDYFKTFHHAQLVHLRNPILRKMYDGSRLQGQCEDIWMLSERFGVNWEKSCRTYHLEEQATKLMHGMSKEENHKTMDEIIA